MRKMTKTAVTLAAMSAMTVAAASMAFAAVKEEANISAIDNTEAPVDSSASGEWGGDAVKGYTFTKTDGTKLKDQWAEIDGVWYYFDGDTIATNEFKILDDKGYFFDENGRLATGWQQITTKMDAYSDIDIPDALYNQYVNTYTTVDETKEYDYQDFVWCYFDEHGVAKKNEWFHDWTGLWYYFDGNAMVKNVYDYVVNPDNYDAADSNVNKLYGFDVNGAMLVGWNSKTLDKNWNSPTADDAGKVWYYYKPNGQMQTTGWASIEGKWYLFADRDADPEKTGENITVSGQKWRIGGYPMLVNSYVASYPNKTATTPEYFYVNSKGELTTGVQNVRKAWKIIFYPEGSTNVRVAWEEDQVKDTDIYVNFAEKNYAAKEGIEGNYYYALDTIDATDKLVEIKKAKFGNTDQVKSMSDGRYDARSIFDSVTAGYNVASDEWQFTDEGPATVSGDNADVRVLAISNCTYPVTGKAIEYLINKDAQTDSVKQIYLKETGKTYYLRTAADVTAVADSYSEYVEAVSNYVDKYNTWVQAVSNSRTTAVTVSEMDGLSFLKSDEYPGTGAVNAVSAACAVSSGWNMVKYADAIKKLDALDNSIGIIMSKAEVGSNAYTAAVSDQNFSNAVRTQLSKIWSDIEIATIVEPETAKREIQDTENAMIKAKAAFDSAVAAGQITSNDYVYLDPVQDAVGVKDTEYGFRVVGERVKNALIGRTSAGIYLANGSGELVKNKVVLIGDDANITLGNQTYNNAYLVFTADGTAAKGYEGTKKSITVGGVTYWATDKTVTLGDAKATVFVSNKQAQTANNDTAWQY